MQEMSHTLIAFPQLQDVGKQLEQELQHLTASYGQLKAAQAKFRTCIESVNAIKPENAGKEILVPLTGSLYVPGTIADTQRVIVDIGTGYYVEKVSSVTSRRI
jgi:prefoldin alpha subunit